MKGVFLNGCSPLLTLSTYILIAAIVSAHFTDVSSVCICCKTDTLQSLKLAKFDCAVYQPSTTERRSNFQRPVYPAPHRQLSDRELLEQIPALRPGLKLNSSALVDDSYKPSTGSKEADRGLRGGSQANLRKPAGSPRQSPLLLPKVCILAIGSLQPTILLLPSPAR